MIIREGLTYDDVLLVPQKSFIDHRADVSTETQLTRNIKLKIPFISANMDTVTEGDMAIALAKEGGIGVIHRFMSIEEQVEQVKKVKRAVGYILYTPFSVGPKTTVKEMRIMSRKWRVDGFVVVDEKNKVLGIATIRDFMFETNPEMIALKVMTPYEKLITAKVGTTFAQAKKIFHKYKIEKLPLIDNNRYFKGLITAKSVMDFEKNPYSTRDQHGRYRLGAAVGVVKDYLLRTEALVNAGADTIVIDVAHGHNDVALRAVKEIRTKFKNVDLIGGNVATKEGVRDLIKMGVDAVKVGIGPGGLCTTRVVTGVGVPQLTAVMECSKEAQKKKVPIIADGGTNFTGDFTKALAAGASTCMLAGWFAGTDESPGGIIIRKGIKYKVHRGSASFLATADRKIEMENHNERQLNTIVPEGVESLVPYKGHVSDIIYQLVGALRSGMSYCNAKTIKQLWKNVEFIKITDAGFRESKAHNIQEL